MDEVLWGIFSALGCSLKYKAIPERWQGTGKQGNRPKNGEPNNNDSVGNSRGEEILGDTRVVRGKGIILALLMTGVVKFGFFFV